MYFRDIESDPAEKQKHNDNQRAAAAARLKRNAEYRKRAK